MVQHGLFEGYAQRLVKGQYPLAVLFLTVPFDRVDVNVHPTKSEVRFAEHRKVHDALKWIVAETLSRIDRPQWVKEYHSENRQIEQTSGISEGVGSNKEVQGPRFTVHGLESLAQSSKLKVDRPRGSRRVGYNPSSFRTHNSRSLSFTISPPF